jgi:CRP-like cAMP-binding protein
VGATSIERAIRNSYFAAGFTEDHVAAINKIAQECRYADGDALLNQFDETRDLLIMVEGRAQILTLVGDAIGIVKAGMPIGEISFLDGKPRSVSVVSVGSSMVAKLPFLELRRLLDSDADMERRFLRNISSVLCARLRSANNNIAALLAIDESTNGYRS